MMTALAERYRDRLPLSASTPIVTLGEGGTPLLRAPRLSHRFDLDVWLKWEGANPTGSFKDRGMTVAVSRALEDGAEALVCASTGNTAASAAAYAARAGLPAVILQPEGAVALGKLAQARATGARLLAVRGTFDQALAAARELATRGTHVLVNSLNPDRIEGQKTAAFEIAEQLGRVPDALVLPFGGGGNTRAYAKGFAEIGAPVPQILAVQSTDRARTVASAIRITDPAHAHEVEEALQATDGKVMSVSDKSVLDAWRLVAQEEGVFCELAAAASVAALETSGLPRSVLVVCVITGHGLKDPETVERVMPPPVVVDPDPDAIAAAAR
jgi:threonine synthase